MIGTRAVRGRRAVELAATLVGHLGGWVGEALYPSTCMACGELSDRAAPGFRAVPMCELCRATVWAIDDVVCHRCGVPFAGGPGICGECLARAPAFERARQSFVFGEAVRAAIHRFKQPSAPARLARHLVRLAVEDGRQPFFEERPDIVVPVPLHPSRTRARGFNQAGLLALELSDRIPRAHVHHALACTRRTQEQKQLGREARERNLRRAFEVARPRVVAGRRVLLVDDVMTTGATARVCASALKSAGAASVQVWALARAVRL